jgi:AraC family transcriptional regulator, activator of mtrCDE
LVARDERCSSRLKGVDCRTMAGRKSVKTPDFISETPDLDLLSDVLQTLRLRALIFKQGSYCGKWALDATGATGTIFHLIGRGQAWLHLKDEREPLVVRGGDLVMFPNADWHQLSGTPRRQPGTRSGETDDGPFTTVLCARVDFEGGRANPVLEALPPVIVVRSEDRGTSAELHALARLMLVEYEAETVGRQGVLARLAEAMFVLVLRHHMTKTPQLKGFLGALKDERVARSLAALHSRPGEGWRVHTLAREAGMSRTAFAERFAALLGRTPMQYLAAWRMHLADEMLRVGRASVAQVAERLGYQTETAFRRAFKRLRGIGPGDVRRRARDEA